MVSVDELGFGRVRSLVFSDLGLGSACFRLNNLKVLAFRRGPNWFEIRFWETNVGLSVFEVQPVKFEAVRSSLYLGSIQH